MSHKKTLLWWLQVRPEAQAVFDGLSTGEKQAIFRRVRELLIADDPYSASFAEMVKGKKYERARKFRAGDYRVLFVIKAEAVTRQKHTYKGTLYIMKIGNRKDVY